jgi:CheY-like chemotaxis protein
MSDSHSTVPFELLLVEDNPGDVRLIREAFREGGTNVHITVASDGEKALAVLRRQEPFASCARPALILLDLNLPRMSGLELLTEIKTDEGLRHIPVVVMTSSRREQDILASYDLNASSCITKPADLEQFLNVMRSLEHFWLRVATLPQGG